MSRLALLGPLALLGACAGAPPLSPVDQPAALRALGAADLRVATIAYRLAVAGEPICPRKDRLTGLTLHDANQYAPALRDAARDVLKVGDRTTVLAVVPDSPAARAGVIVGDVLLAIDGVALPSIPPTTRASYAANAAAHAMLDRASLARSFAVAVERGNAAPAAVVRLDVAPANGCASRVQLRTSPDVEAKADGRTLSVTTALVDYVQNDDELALAIAHEMAHNALGHRVSLEARGVTPGRRRQSRADEARILDVERVADRFGYYLMARAGFDPGVAPGFWERLYAGPARSRDAPGTHPDAANRVAQAIAIAREIATRQSRDVPLTP